MNREHAQEDDNELTSGEPSAATPLVASVQESWLAVYQAAQTQTAQAHAAWQAAMAEAHLAFLRTAETAIAGLTAMLSGDRMLAPALAMASSGEHAPVRRAIAEFPAPTPASLVTHLRESAPAPEAAPRARESARSGQGQSGAAPLPTPRPAPPVEVAPAVPQAAAGFDASTLEALLLEVVAEKTGYPSSMLELTMSLEADLGIDSIKRVEILAALRARVPELPEVPASDLARLSTLGQIVEFMRAGAN